MFGLMDLEYPLLALLLLSTAPSCHTVGRDVDSYP